MKTLLLLIAGSILTIHATAQDYIRPGYIVLNSGDTVRGFVHDLEWLVNPTSINFQKTTAEAVATYGIDDIAAFLHVAWRIVPVVNRELRRQQPQPEVAGAYT